MDNVLSRKKIGIVGCGNMGSAIIKALVHHKAIKKKNIILFDKESKKTVPYKKRFSIHSARNMNEIGNKADIIILAVKPQNIARVANAIAKSSMKKKLLISILAGTTMSKLSKYFGKKSKIIRAMPNLGVTIGAGFTGVCKNNYATKHDLRIADIIFSCCGETIHIPERLFNIITALSGSGPAYYFYLTELIIHEGHTYGLNKRTATQLAIQTAAGASQLMAQSTLTPGELRKRVTSPGGTTEAAFDVFSKGKYNKLFSNAIKKAIQRAQVLSK